MSHAPSSLLTIETVSIRCAGSIAVYQVYNDMLETRHWYHRTMRAKRLDKVVLSSSAKAETSDRIDPNKDLDVNFSFASRGYLQMYKKTVNDRYSMMFITAPLPHPSSRNSHWTRPPADALEYPDPLRLSQKRAASALLSVAQWDRSSRPHRCHLTVL